jgi:dTDP-glucose 4,6-dehydratase
MKHILVTGGCGFIGSNFLNYMVQTYPQLQFYNIDCLNYCASEENVTVRSASNYKFIRGDITSYDLILHVLKEYSIDTIVHFAAQSHVDTSFTNSFQYTRDNVMGTHTLLEAVRVYGGIEKFVHVSTDEVYGENGEEDTSIKCEKSILMPTNPYAATKAAAEMLVCSYYKSFKLPIVITRGNNTYGPHQYPEKVIPKFIQLIREGHPCTIHGDGSALRNFVYVDDVVKAFEAVLLRGVIGEIYNIGGDEHTEISVLDLTHELIKLLHGREAQEGDIQRVKDREFNDQRYWITNAKIKGLGWKPSVDLKEGLQKTIAFYTRA